MKTEIFCFEKKIEGDRLKDLTYHINFYFKEKAKIIEIDSSHLKLEIITEFEQKVINDINNFISSILMRKEIIKDCIYKNDIRAEKNIGIDEQILDSYVTDFGDGLIEYRGDYFKLFKVFDSLFVEIANKFNAQSKSYPSLISTEALDRCGYIDSFAQYMTFTSHLQSDTEDISNFINTRDNKYFSKLKHALNPAVCIHCYREIQDRQIKNPITITSIGKCYRYESGNLNPFDRLWEFNMREIVFIDTDYERIKQNRMKSFEYVKELIEKTELECMVETASDPFFKNRDKIKDIQLLTKVKYEILAKIPHKDKYLAIGSLNIHGQHFTNSFNISGESEMAYTGCTAFGVERWVYAFLSQYGICRENWPKFIREKVEELD